MKFSELPEDERAEVIAAVRDSYQTGNGVRSHRAALTEFECILDDAEQAHRQWVTDLRRQWLVDGMRKFLQEQWKAHAGSYVVLDQRGRAHRRDMVRGAKVIDETGKVEQSSIQLELFGRQELLDAIRHAGRQIEENRLNLDHYRRLLNLLEQTGTSVVADGLALVGKTLDEFLNQDNQKSA